MILKPKYLNEESPDYSGIHLSSSLLNHILLNESR